MTEHDEDGVYVSPAEPLSAADIKLTAEIVSFLEHEWGVNARRLQVHVRSGALHIQGNVDSRDLAQEIEKRLESYPGVKSVDCFLSAFDGTED